MPSSVIIEPELTLTGGIPQPKVTALRGASSIEALDTNNFSFSDIILPVIAAESQLTGWQFLPGTADPSDPQNQVNALSGAGYWQRVAGFGSAMLAGARLTNSTATTLSHGTATALTFDTARFSSGGWISTDPSKFTVTVPGIYFFSLTASFAANGTGQRTAAIRVNGSTVISSSTCPATSQPVQVTTATAYQMKTGDYVEWVVTQNSGANLDVLKADAYSPEAVAMWIGSNTVIGTSQINNDGGISSTPPSSGTGQSVTTFQTTDIGWYRVYQGVVPAAGGFRLKRADSGDGNIGDFEIDFSITGGSPEGTIHLKRNAASNALTPAMDAVRVSHEGSTSYVDVHLLLSGTWTILRSAADTDGYVDAPYRNDAAGVDGSLLFNLTPNVVGGTIPVDTTQVNTAGRKILSGPTTTWGQWTGTASTASRDTATATTAQNAQAIKAILDILAGQGVVSFGIPSTMTYNDMLSLASYLVTAGTQAVVTNVTKITAQTGGTVTITGVYVPVGTLNAKARYYLRGYEYKTGSSISSLQWNGSIWEIYDSTGARQFHQNAGTTNPWDAATWKDEANTTQTVTFVAPNITFTYGTPSDTHTACYVTGSTTGYNGLYLRGSDSNGKRQYFLVGTGTNNKRIQWTGSAWDIKDNSVTAYESTESVTYPDQVTSWTVKGGGGAGDVVSVARIDDADLSSGCLVQGDATVEGLYVPEIGANNVSGGRALIYRNISLGTVLIQVGIGPGNWGVYDDINLFTNLANSVPISSVPKFPWEIAWLGGITAQQNIIAAPSYWT